MHDCKCRPPIVGVLGCMAERLKVKLLDSDKLVDLVAGPDAYRDIPRLLDTIEVNHQSQMQNVCSPFAIHLLH